MQDTPTADAGALTLGPGQGDAIWFLTNRITIKATARATGGAYGLFEAELPAGFSPPLHVHHREDESFWILEGEFTVRCGAQTFRASPGAFVFAPRGIPHTFVVDGPSPGRLLTLVTPGGAEAFFAAVGRPAAGDGLPPPGPLDIPRLTEVGARFGIEIVGPPMTPAQMTRARTTLARDAAKEAR
jgi:mannose-6-phosphate isomerase-like protein (cupin superfamily)